MRQEECLSLDLKVKSELLSSIVLDSEFQAARDEQRKVCLVNSVFATAYPAAKSGILQQLTSVLVTNNAALHIISSCPQIKLKDDLQRLHSADDVAVQWLPTHGPHVGPDCK